MGRTTSKDGSDVPAGRKRSKLGSIIGASRRFVRTTKDSVGSAFSGVSLTSASSLLSVVPTSTQMAVWGVVGGTILWALIASVLLIMASQLYKNQAIDEARERYTAVGAERVGAEAVAVLSGAIAVRDSIEYAVQRKLYFEPMDYTSVRLALEPVMVAMPSIMSIELAFVGRNESLMLRRRDGGQGVGSPSQILVQSDVPECIEQLGHLGCLSSLPARDQPWYTLGNKLADGPSSTKPAFQWMDHPGFVEHVRKASTNSSDINISALPELYQSGATAVGIPAKKILWNPAYSLVFRSNFPGTGGTLSVIGRVTMEVSSLNANRNLVDEARLGTQGRIFICDRSGVVLGAANTGAQVLVQSPAGRVRFRHVWELGESWASSLTLADFQQGAHKRFVAEGFQIVLAPLQGRGMGHFLVVTVAEKGPFRDDALEALAGMSETIVALPLPVALFTAAILKIYREYKKRQSLRRVHPGDRSPMWGSTGSFFGGSSTPTSDGGRRNTWGDTY